jgi:hypothetical protein
MADSNLTGLSTGRKGSDPIQFTHKATSVGTAAVATPIVIQASPLNPVYIEGQVWIETASGGTSPTVGIGTTTASTNLMALTSATAAGFFPANNAVGKTAVSDTTQIYIIEGGTPNNAGVYHVIVTAASLNLNPTN